MLPVLSIALPVFGLILIGGIAGKAGFLGRDATGALNMFVVYLSLPAVMFQAMAHIPPAELTNGGLIGAFGLGIAMPGLIALALARRQRVPLGNAAMSALPTGASAFILAKLYGREVASTSGTVLVSTVASFGTLSVLLAWFAQ